ncbi:cytohesin-1a isoform X4 [Hippocampus zosterae]|uniref:cytohesin-1a isoform X4 n=1 Tax=Hippocampus zosterae TaxID=109293 RepID=UPI00223D1098|nr:cytohesin-1a isoform X4 [Hippocampus zosterae]
MGTVNELCISSLHSFLCPGVEILQQAAVPDDLTPEEQQELENIRRRKLELLEDIQRLKDEIAEVTNEIENLGSTEERKTMQRNKQVAMGRKKFNMDPKKGIQFLIENDLLKNTSDDIAQFLCKGEGLNKTAIGDYLGERDEFNIQVLHAFVELHEFTDLNLVQALRQFLWSFRLPGEAQKIDRMMEAFAQRYCQCNPGVFQSTDTCYILSFAIIMLNTSLHNPNVKDKPTVERFISMNRGINEGGDLPEDLLRNLYDSIKNEPFKIPEDDGNDLTHTFFNPDREGWLLKLGGMYTCSSQTNKKKKQQQQKTRSISQLSGAFGGAPLLLFVLLRHPVGVFFSVSVVISVISTLDVC